MKQLLFIISILCTLTAQAQSDYAPLKQSVIEFDRGAFDKLSCSVPVAVTYTVNDSVSPAVSPIGLNVYVDCVDVRVDGGTLHVVLNLPEYMNAPGVNELQINITGPALTRIEVDGKCQFITVGNMTLASPMSVFASQGANLLLRDRITAPAITASADPNAVIGFFTVDTPRMNILAKDMSIVNLYAPAESGTGHVGNLEVDASILSTVTVSNTICDTVTDRHDDTSRITVK